MTMDSPDEAQAMQTRADDKKSKQALLASKYTQTKRRVEIASLCAAVTLGCISFIRICNMYFLQNVWVFLCACVMSMYLADFISGIFHWIADTWGSLDTPLIGNTFIRSFREHHLEPIAMCRHDVFECNGDNCMLVVPLLMLTAALPIKQNDLYFLFIFCFLLLVSFWIALTNQIHKWTHTYRLPFYAKWAMDLGLILSKKDHAIHHRNPFDKYYCITTGWLNPILANINFWKRLEGVVTYASGFVPREDDMLWAGITAKNE